MVDFGKNAVVFNVVTCEHLPRFHKNHCFAVLITSLSRSVFEWIERLLLKR